MFLKTNSLKLLLKNTLELVFFFTPIYEDKIYIFLRFELLNLNRILRSAPEQNAAQCTLHLHLYTLNYTMNTVHCIPYIYTTCCTFITSHSKHPRYV